ncbi:minor capsid protein [Salinibacillus xinjiangensis]|uniref:Minor capsid protein n=1 Tax=Salinibacillus xinjiangensis TaxID=1229268 RepID=A0A6G1X7M4_9BACI|nr:minor capsid protein [Salinibacillus xinjiangensis]MRG87003.1 minor capsid protein [Salinibacillus xinjiangensis]
MFRVKVDLGDIQGKVSKAVGFGQFALDEQVLKDSNFYIPKNEGTLEESGVIHSQPLRGKGEVVWNTPYARRLYYNPQYDFSKDKNPEARGLWFEHAKSQHLKEWLEVADDATKKGL